MPRFENLEEWIAHLGGQEGAAAFLKTRQPVISQWIRGRRAPGARWKEKMKKHGYDGPFPERDKKVSAFVSRDEFLKWAGRIEKLEHDFSALSPGLDYAKQLGARVQALENRKESRGKPS